MIGKIAGAVIGERLARRSSKVGGASGAALGVIASTALRRLSIPAMLALAAGGYAVKKLSERNDNPKAVPRKRRPPTKAN